MSSSSTSRFLRSEDGSVSIIGAFLISVLICVAALAIDLGLAFVNKRQLQAATDAAALAASQDPANAATVAAQVMTNNGFSGTNIVGVTTGNYQPTTTLAPNARYSAGVTPVNAVSLTASLSAPLRLAATVLPIKSLTLSVHSTASQLDEASIVAGSGIASLNNGLLNSILGTMLGTNISLTAVQYQGLISTNINAIDFLNALAAQLSVTGGTYGSLLSGTCTMGQIIAASISALQTEGAITSSQVAALQGLQLIAASLTGAPTVNLGTLISAGVWRAAKIGSLDSSSALQANLNLYQLTTFSAQIANGSNMVAGTNVLTIPGVANVSIALTGIEPAQQSYFGLGPINTTVHTAQVRLLLTAKLLSGVSFLGLPAPVNLPVYVELADGTATVSGISCFNAPNIDTTVAVTARSGVANAYIGAVNQSAMTNFSQPVTVTPATIVNLVNLITVTGSAQTAVQGNTTTLTFNRTQIQAQTPQTVTSTNMTSNLLQNMGSTMTLSANVVGLPISGAAAVAIVQPALQPVFASLDSVVDQVLETLGIRVGYLDVTVNGSRCGIGNLVQ